MMHEGKKEQKREGRRKKESWKNEIHEGSTQLKNDITKQAPVETKEARTKYRTTDR